MKLDAVLDLEVPEEEVVKRIAGRELIRMGYEKSLDWA